MPTAPFSASRHQRRFARLTALTVAATRRAWRRMEAAARWQEQYDQQVGPQIAAVVAASQMVAAREADSYVTDVIAELDLTPPNAAPDAGVLLPRAFAGVTGAGLPIETLLGRTVADAGQRFNALTTDTPEAVLSTANRLPLAQQALDEAQDDLDGYVQTILADAMRAAEEAAMAKRPWVSGYIRVAEPGACSRCILLSGRFYLFNEGFLRHPRCRCNHIPAPDARTDAGKRQRDDMRTVNSPERMFEALSREEQDHIFTAAGAQAIRDGADIGQVVNARRGMSKAQSGRLKRVSVNGRDVYVTTSGTTGRGRRNRRTLPTRLMPESILEIAGADVAERIRLLRVHGYIT